MRQMVFAYVLVEDGPLTLMYMDSLIHEINMFRRDAYFQQLESALDQGTLQECTRFIRKIRECRHRKVKERQLRKFHALEQKTSGHSKQDVHKNREEDGTTNQSSEKNK